MTQDNELLAALVGGIFGAALASPNQEDKKSLEAYKTAQAEINSRTQKIPISQAFISKVGKRPEYYSAFVESYRAYSHGLFRSSVIVASALIESMLRNKFEGNLAYMFNELMKKREIKKRNFYELIEEAKKTKFIDDKDYYFLHGLRSGRNDSAHDVLKEVSEIDSVMTLNIAIKIIEKLM